LDRSLDREIEQWIDLPNTDGVQSFGRAVALVYESVGARR
jgi:hypothetical protein